MQPMIHNFFKESPLFSEMMEQKTKHGLDKLDLMIQFMLVMEAEVDKVETELDKFKSWLAGLLKRRLTLYEEHNLVKGILKYIQSEPGTLERIETMKYLFDAEFLNVENKIR